MTQPESYATIKEGIRPGESHFEFLERAIGVIIPAAVIELANLTDGQINVQESKAALEDTIKIYTTSFKAFLVDGSFDSIFNNPVMGKPFADQMMGQPSALAKSELSRVAKASGSLTKNPPETILANTPYSLLENATLSILGITNFPEDQRPSPEMVLGSALDKIGNYDKHYVHAMLGTLNRIMDTEAMGIQLSPKAERLVKVALMQASVLWQTRQVLRYLHETITNPDQLSKRLQDSQFAPYSEMVHAVFDDNKEFGNQYALARAIFALIQDFHECVE